MNKSLNEKTRTLQITHRIGFWEGISYLLLLFIAMPLKYAFGFPAAVKWMGSVHGFLFVAFMIMLYYSFMTKVLTSKGAARAFLLSLVPFGTFYLSFDKSVN
jgi:integral membrane protein